MVNVSDAFDGLSLNEKVSFYLEENLLNSEDFTACWISFFSVVAFLILLVASITARRRQWSTLSVGFLFLWTLFGILFSLQDSDWYSGFVERLVSNYCYLHPETSAVGQFHVYFGLRRFYISFYEASNMSFWHNQYFAFEVVKPGEHLTNLWIAGLTQGLPAPFLIILDYLSTHEFNWGKRISAAGSFTEFTLILSLSIWALGVVLFVATPFYGIFALILNGIILLSTVLVYQQSLPSIPIMFIDGTPMHFSLGRSYYIIVTIALCNCLGGILMWFLVQFNYCTKISTFLEINFDTPWDNRRIMQDSTERKEAAIGTTFERFRNSVRRSVRRFGSSFNSRIQSRFQAARALSVSTTELANMELTANSNGVIDALSVTDEATETTRF